MKIDRGYLLLDSGAPAPHVRIEDLIAGTITGLVDNQTIVVQGVELPHSGFGIVQYHYHLDDYADYVKALAAKLERSALVKALKQLSTLARKDLGIQIAYSETPAELGW